MEQQGWQALQLGNDRLGAPHLIDHHQRERSLLVLASHQGRRIGVARQGERLGAAHLPLRHRMAVVGIAQAMAGGAGRQDRGIEGGGTEHQLPRRRAAQLLVQLLQPYGRAHRGSLQLGFVHHDPHIGVEGGEVARPAPARAAVAPHQLAAYHLIQGAHDHGLSRQGIKGLREAI